ncbi:SoxR reducing system RseC family protein [Fusibacter bizertensis]|jgi:Positive regulator of sigma E activity|uniref:SoxR reducing system RseC family protein n=1 Tax=Fusibacter bizertensis TaxID=1488331 RepID=A0ABT6N9N8_9FIRM|nr:SoxR reducing system RseC family protein [Fusibacter bizertensis]MDH8677128.1 SoxR reducing system RseC family protein [Fusibacter bizertensis]
MDRAGIVVSQMGEYSRVKLVRHTACGNCGACQLGDDQKDIMLVAKNAVKAKDGDLVEVSMETGGVLSAAFIMYILPLVGLFIGLLVGQTFFKGSDVMTALLGLVFMAAIYLVIKMNDKRFLRNEKYTAKILKILQSEHDGMVPLA